MTIVDIVGHRSTDPIGIGTGYGGKSMGGRSFGARGSLAFLGSMTLVIILTSLIPGKTGSLLRSGGGGICVPAATLPNNVIAADFANHAPGTRGLFW